MRTKIALLGVVIATALNGCAGYTVYSDAAMQNKAPLKFYNAKPYLLVALTGNKEKPIEVSLISLPDIASPVYINSHAGLGSSDLSFALSNGMLTNFGFKQDSGTPALLTALGGFIKPADAKGPAAAAASAPHQFVLFEIVSTADGIILRQVAFKP